MADLNNTIVRGKLRVTEDINANGNIAGSSITGNGSGLTNLNASNIGSGTLSADRLATSGAAAGSYGPSANATPGYGKTFSVPYITVDNKGRVTKAETKTVKIPASDNTDTKVTSVDNHYSPTANSGAELTATLSGTAGAYAKDTEYTVLTGVKAQRDAKGHVTGLTYTAQKIKDTNTTYTKELNAKLDKTTYEWNKEFAAGSNGAISLGRYNVYDSQLTFDITSTTHQSISGKLVIATQNGTIHQAKVFGDASGALVSKLIIYQSAISNSRSWVEVFCNFNGWSKNKVHIYAVALNSATVQKQMTSVTISNGVPAAANITSGDAKWTGTIVNDFNNVSNIIESALKKKNKIYVLSSVTSDTGAYLDSGNRKFADKSAVLQLTMSEPGDSWATDLYLITGNEEKRVYPSELLLGDIIMTKDPEYPMRIITDISKNFRNGVFVSTTVICTAVNSNDINDISQLKKDSEYFYCNSNSRVLTTSQDFGTKFGYVLLGTFNSSSRGSVNIHATYGDSGKRSAVEMNVSFNSSGTPTGYYTGTEANYDDGYCSLMVAQTETDTSKLGLYMRLRGNVTYTIVINMPTNKNGGGSATSDAPFSIVNAYTMIRNDSSWDPAKAVHWTTVNQSSMKSIGDDMLKITGSSGFGDANWHYRKIGHFIFNSSDTRNGAPVHISGVIGSWAQEKMIFDIFVSTRGSLKVNGFVRGKNPSCRLVIDNTENPNIFLAVKGFATYNITVDTFENAKNENNAVRGSFHIDWTGGDDFSGSDVGVTATNFGYQDLLTKVASQRAAYNYTGSFSETSGTMTKLCEVNGGETGKIICVHGAATSAGSELSIQRKTSHYYDYDCIAVAPTGYNSGTHISCTGVVPPRLQYSVNTDSSVESTYYIFGKNVSEVYVITFDLP